MKKRIRNFIFISLFCCLPLTNVFAQDNVKLAQSGFKFLSVVSDARAAAMADAMTSLQIGSSSLFFNPAGMAELTGYADVTFSINQWIADIRHYTFSGAISPFQGDYGVLGFSVQSVNYGDFYGTRWSGNDQGYEDIGIFTKSAWALGLGYAKLLTDRFSVGGHIRWVYQDLGESMTAVNIQPDAADTLHGGRSADTVYVHNELWPFIFDFGTQFKTGFKSLVFGMSVRNFSQELKYAEEGFQAPLTFTLGISMNLMDLMEKLSFDQSLFLCIDASHYRDHPEQLKMGLDYKVMNTFSLRGGFVTNSDQNAWSFGIGVSKFGFVFDYAYKPFGVFDNVQRFTARYSF